MAEEQPPPPASSDHDLSPDQNETDWGADWESAFQAEDDMFFSEDGEDFFLAEEEEPATTTASQPEAAGGRQPGPSAGADQQKGQEKAAPGPGRETRSLLAVVVAGLAGLPRLLARITSGLTALPLSRKILALAAAGGLGLLVFFAARFLLSPAPPLPPETASPPPAAAPAARPASPPRPEKLRVRWTLPPFFIPVAAGGTKEPSPRLFLEVRLSLLTLLDHDQSPPKDREGLLQDLIYRFFRNQPLEKLRHYALARGELQHDLRAWLLQHWPQAPIETVIFDRYRLD